MVTQKIAGPAWVGKQAPKQRIIARRKFCHIGSWNGGPRNSALAAEMLRANLSRACSVVKRSSGLFRLQLPSAAGNRRHFATETSAKWAAFGVTLKMICLRFRFCGCLTGPNQVH